MVACAALDDGERVIKGLLGHIAHGDVGEERDMWSDDDIRHRDERVVCLIAGRCPRGERMAEQCRFTFDYIESGGCYLMVLQSRNQRLRVHDGTARSIDEDGSRFHLRESVGVHEMVGGLVQICVHADHIGACQQIVLASEGDAAVKVVSFADIVAKYGHAERVQHACKRRADTPHADDADRQLAQFPGHQTGRGEILVRITFTVLGDVPEQLQDVGEGELGDRTGGIGGDVGDAYAVFMRGFHVDGVDACGAQRDLAYAVFIVQSAVEVWVVAGAEALLVGDSVEPLDGVQRLVGQFEGEARDVDVVLLGPLVGEGLLFGQCVVKGDGCHDDLSV